MSKKKLKYFNILKVCMVLILLVGFSGCNMLAKFFDPNRNVLTRKVVVRDKPNLDGPETDGPAVDPDSDELVEEKDDDSEGTTDNTNTETTQEDNSSDNSETNSDNSDTEKPSSEQPNSEQDNGKNAGQKANAIAGKWMGTENGQSAVFEFSQSSKQGDRYVGKFTVFVDNEPIDSATYTVLNDNSIELNKDGKSVKVKCDVSADGKTMRFTGTNGQTINLTRTN